MADSWVTKNPSSGTGTMFLNIGASNYWYGRIARSSNIIVVTTSGGLSETISATQVGYSAAPVLLPDSVSINVGYDGGTVYVQLNQQGTNSRGISSLTLTPTSGTYVPTYQCQYKTRDSSSVWTNFNVGTPIPGDPGATWVYDIRIALSFSENPSITSSRAVTLNFSLYDYSTILTSSITQAKRELIHYTVNVGFIMSVDSSMGDDTEWTMSFNGAIVDTLIDGNFRINKGGSFDVCYVNGVVNDSGESSLLIYNQQGTPWKRNPDFFDGNYEGWQGSGTSQVSGYICDGVVVN